MPGKIIFPRGKVFLLENDQILDRQAWFSELKKQQREALNDWIGIFGTKDGFNITSMGGEQGGNAIDVSANGIIFHGAKENQWTGMRFDHETPAVDFLVFYGSRETKIRMVPVTEKEMKAELKARQKPSRKER